MPSTPVSPRQQGGYAARTMPISASRHRSRRRCRSSSATGMSLTKDQTRDKRHHSRPDASHPSETNPRMSDVKLELLGMAPALVERFLAPPQAHGVLLRCKNST